MEDKKKKTTKKKKKGINSTILIIVLIVAGLLVMFYPTISNLYNEMTGSYAIQEFNEQLGGQSETMLAEQKRMAEAYNAALLNNPNEINCPYEYEDIMDFGNGMMGYIEIPAIDVYLPVYHSVEESVLSKGVGHIPKTAFPIGGENNHSVLSGHTGLPSAELFTDLAEVKEGDQFFIHVLGETIAYEVDQILVVLPEEADNLLPVAGEDYCTLVTCTPYGVNSHRLLVRGSRIAFVEEMEAMVQPQEEDTNLWTIIWVCAGIGIGIIVLILGIKFAKKKR